jgi:hypothetical protein
MNNTTALLELLEKKLPRANYENEEYSSDSENMAKLDLDQASEIFANLPLSMSPSRRFVKKPARYVKSQRKVPNGNGVSLPHLVSMANLPQMASGPSISLQRNPSRNQV